MCDAQHEDKVNTLIIQCVLTCHGLSQSRGMGKAPTQAPTTVQATVICRHVSHTDMALNMEQTDRRVSWVQIHKLNAQNVHEGQWAHPCRLKTRIQAWTLGPRTQRHLSVVRDVSSTAREKVSKAFLGKTEIRHVEVTNLTAKNKENNYL